MIKKNILIVFLSCVLFASCQHSPGLMRTNFNHYYTKEYNSLGFSLELPVQENDQKFKYYEDVSDSGIFKENSDTLGGLLLAFHPIYGTHILSEPVYLIDFSVSRLSSKQFELFKNDKHYLLNNPCYRVIAPGLSKNITENYVFDSLNRREYECLYKTVTIENGDTLVCLGRILLEDESNLEYNIQQLRGIMNSITVIK